MRKQRRERTVINRAMDGSTVRLADPAGELTDWMLSYAELSDGEIQLLQDFFVAAEGRLNSFTFLDPTSNLLAWSEDYSNAVWQLGPLLTATKGNTAWTLSNSGGGAQSITQTIAGPGNFLYCLSAWVRATTAVDLTLRIAGRSATRRVTEEWGEDRFQRERGRRGELGTCSGWNCRRAKRWRCAHPGGAAGGGIGVQDDEQGRGVRRGAVRRGFPGGDHDGTTNRHSCTVKIIHANHL